MRIIRLFDTSKNCKCECSYSTHKCYYGSMRVSGCRECDKICVIDTENLSEEETQIILDKMNNANIKWKFADFERIVKILGSETTK